MAVNRLLVLELFRRLYFSRHPLKLVIAGTIIGQLCRTTTIPFNLTLRDLGRFVMLRFLSFATLVSGLIATCMSQETFGVDPSIETFQANYVAAEEASLATPNGKRIGVLPKGTLVAGRLVHEGILDVKTADGKGGFASARSFSRLGSSIVVTAEAEAVAQAGNQFAFDLYRQARPKTGNLFISPAGISTVLAMTYGGAAGRTRQEMARVLHFTPELSVDAGYSTLMELLNSTGDRNGYTLNTANRLWGAQSYRFENGFLKLTREYYRAPLETLDFSQSEEARTTINGWVAQQTHKRIVDLIPPGLLTSDTRLVLTNAVYFLGGWAEEFSNGATKNALFYRSADSKQDVPTMYQQETFAHTEDADAQVVSLPYRGRALSMVIVLPKDRAGLNALEEKLTAERFAGWIGKLTASRPVDVYLPKFKLHSQLRLSDVLKQLGMATAFSKEADFSGISSSEGLGISEVIHQAVVEVDEKGTEAAAATAVVMTPTAAPVSQDPPKPIVFRADHPFLFAIRDMRTGAILFLGRLERPLE